MMNLKDTRDKFHCKAAKHKNSESVLTYIFYVLGGGSTVLLLIASISTGIKSFDATFFITAVAALLNTLIAFFKINNKISLHHSFASDCKDLEYTIISYLQSNHSEEENIVFKKTIINQQKRLYDREISNLPCLD